MKLNSRQQRELIAGMNALVGTPLVETPEHIAGRIPAIKDADYNPGGSCGPAFDRELARKIAALSLLEAAE